MKTNTLLLRAATAFVSFAATATTASAALRLPAVISDHAMLQSQVPIAIWGWAQPGDTVTVSFETPGGKLEGFDVTAAADGRWSGQLPTFKAGTSGQIQVKTARGDSAKVDDVLIGEVWLCGGQSNMSYLVNTQSKSVNERTTPELLATAQSEATAAAGTLRYFATRQHPSDAPLDDVEGKWIVATPETVGGCFALSWNFAVTLHEKIHQPIGLIDSAVGGTVVEAWTPRPELDASSAGPDLEQRYKDKAAKTPPPPTNPNIPARLYNGMIRGLEPYTLKGVIWFQGDGNCPHPQDYGVLFKTLITAWRAHFHNEHLPFYYVEMQNYRAPQTQPVEPNALSEIREQQQAALELPETDVATGVDQGVHVPKYEAHFPDKKPLGQRLAGLALDHLYGQPGLVHSPQFQSFKVEGNKIRLQLKYADGLRLRGNELTGFAIRTTSGQWAWAKGQIDGHDILLWNDQVTEPAAVRYAWAYHPLLSVENNAGLPLRPFRTDTESKN